MLTLAQSISNKAQFLNLFIERIFCTLFADRETQVVVAFDNFNSFYSLGYNDESNL